jgi:uncharacterized membrane protein YgcG
MQAMRGTPENSLRRLVETANLIQDVMVQAPEQEQEQAAQLRGLADQMLRVAYNGEEPCKAVRDEIPTLHYLHAHLVTTMQMIKVKRAHLESAQHLDKIITSAFRKGFPANVVHRARKVEFPIQRQAREVEEAQADRVVRRAYSCLLSAGVGRQKIIDGTQSTTTGYSHQMTSLSDSESDSGSESDSSTIKTRGSMASKKSGRSGKKEKRGGHIRGDKELVTLNREQADKLLDGCKNKAYVKMCEVVMDNGLEEYVSMHVQERLRVWLDTQRQGWTEEIRRTVEGFTIDAWAWDSKTVSGGQKELDKYDFEGRSHTIQFNEMWIGLINIAQQHFWTVNTICQQLRAGATLEGKAKETLRVAKKSDAILSASAPAVGDIREALFVLGQIRVRLYLLVGKPIDGGVLNTWISQILWDNASAASNYDKYTQLKELVLHKSGCTAHAFKEELVRQTKLTPDGLVWWGKVQLALNQAEKIHTTMGRDWVMTWDSIQAVVDSVHQEELVKEQVVVTTTSGGRIRNSVVGALLMDQQVTDREGSTKEGYGSGDQRTPPRVDRGRDRDRSQSPARSVRDRSSSPYWRGQDHSPYRGGRDYYGGDRGYHMMNREERDRDWRGYDRWDERRGGGDERRGGDRDGDRGGRGGGRGGSHYGYSGGGYGGGGYYGRPELQQCTCGVSHREATGADCPWRPVDADGKPKLKEYNGWDLRYFCTKSPALQTAMGHRFREMPRSHAAAMKPEVLAAFEKAAKAST